MALLPVMLVALLVLPAAGLNYTNPIVTEPGQDLGDPGAIFEGGYYYLATSSGDRPDAYPIHRSADLAHWEKVGYVFPAWNTTGPVWGKGAFWAPDLQRINATHFAVYFSAKDESGLLSLGVAFSTSVTGPYVDIGKPLWANHSDPQGTIDVHMHKASTGEKYLVWKNNQDIERLEFNAHIKMQQLADSGAALVGDAWTIATADQSWETFGCVEAPWIVERGGDLFLFYSGSMVNWPLTTYAVGVAKAPRGNIRTMWTKREGGPILHHCGIPFLGGLTPGHCSVLPVHNQTDRWAMFYHGRSEQKDAGRVLMMDEVKWGSDGWPHMANSDGCPSSIPTPVP